MMTRPCSSLPRLALLAVCPLVGLGACGSEPAQASRDPVAGRVEVADALCRPTPKGRDVTGCYLTLTSSRADRLVSVSSPRAREVQIHEMKMENGMMKMAQRPEGLPLPAGETVRLASGGDHLMVFGLDAPLAEGDQLSLTLTFESSAQQGVRFAVGQPAPSSR